MIKSEQRQAIDVRLEILEQYIIYLKQKGISDVEIQKHVMSLSETLFTKLLEKGI